MSADAMARLREELKFMHEHGMRYCDGVAADDLRALLDAHDDALDALEELTVIVVGHVEDCDRLDSFTAQPAIAVLAKAGRR